MTRPIYIKILVAAIVIYVIGATVMLTDMYFKIGEIEHCLAHNGLSHAHKH